MSKNIILYTYLVACVLCFFSLVLEFDSLVSIIKPLLIPILVGYYLKVSKGEYEVWVIISFISYYIAEMLFLFDAKLFYLMGVSFFLGPYLILFYRLVKKNKLLQKTNILNKINFVIVFVFVFLTYLYLSVMLIIDMESILEKILLYFYGFFLLSLSILSFIIYILRSSTTNLFLIMSVITFIMSDVFCVFIIKIDNNIVFKSIYLIAQLFSYYFFVCYCIFNAEETEINKIL